DGRRSLDRTAPKNSESGRNKAPRAGKVKPGGLRPKPALGGDVLRDLGPDRPQRLQPFAAIEPGAADIAGGTAQREAAFALHRQPEPGAGRLGQPDMRRAFLGIAVFRQPGAGIAGDRLDPDDAAESRPGI